MKMDQEELHMDSEDRISLKCRFFIRSWLPYDAFITQRHNDVDIADHLLDSTDPDGGTNGRRRFDDLIADYDGVGHDAGLFRRRSVSAPA